MKVKEGNVQNLTIPYIMGPKLDTSWVNSICVETGDFRSR